MTQEKQNIPEHIAVIMDGNGRWAKSRGLPVSMGHREGVNSVRKITRACRELGVKILTLYAFSTENWKRSDLEVNALMKLLTTYLDKKTDELKTNGIKFSVIGDINGLPLGVQKRIKYAVSETRGNSAFILNLALNYGSRQEILNAVKGIASDVSNGILDIDSIDEHKFSRYLYTKDIPDPDLLIRTSGEMRISNFLLWQISYAEIFISDKLWPDFDKDALLEAVESFKQRKRRFGGR